MITGANTNVRHRGIVFHVQTEDSGRTNPHVISHLYHHGTILASQKTEYTEHLDKDQEGLEEVVRSLIDAQHGKMLAGLKSGDYDTVIQERLNPAGPTGDDAATDGQATDGIETPTPMPEVEAREDSLEKGVSARDVNARPFGEGRVSQKPLDEVILEYLSDKARDRADKSAQKSRSSG